MSKVEIIGLKMPLIEKRCDLVDEILKAVTKSNIEILDHDIVVITDKLISKCLGRVVNINDVKASEKAFKIARKTRLNPKFVEIVIKNSDEIVSVIPIKRLIEKGLIELKSLTRDPEASERILNEYLPVILITRRENMLWSNSGVDTSNLPPGYYSIPIEDHDLIAKIIRESIYKTLGRRVAVVICDTEIFLKGSLDFARGSYGIDPIDRCFACKDLYEKPKFGGVDMIVHEVCSAAALVLKQAAEGTPVAIVRGVEYRECECGYKDSTPKVNTSGVIKEIFRENIRVLGLRGLLKILRMII